MRERIGKKARPKKPPAWSHEASPRAAVAIAQLLWVKKEQAILAKKSALLQQIVIQEGGGAACGVRAAIRHQHARAAWRFVRVKERTLVVLLPEA